ncbi:hypothetical protein [Rhizohabitans arisaemae]|nr:hypothetical protein [Rhizohabitans arisaemae]
MGASTAAIIGGASPWAHAMIARLRLRLSALAYQDATDAPAHPFTA